MLSARAVDLNRLRARGSDRLHLTGLLRDAEGMLTTARDLEFALVLLAHYRSEIESMRGNMIPVAQADSLLAKAALASSCAGIIVPALAAR